MRSRSIPPLIRIGTLSSINSHELDSLLSKTAVRNLVPGVLLNLENLRFL